MGFGFKGAFSEKMGSGFKRASTGSEAVKGGFLGSGFKRVSTGSEVVKEVFWGLA